MHLCMYDNYMYINYFERQKHSTSALNLNRIKNKNKNLQEKVR